MQTEGGLGQLLHPLSGTEKILVRDSLYQALPRDQFIPDVLQLVSGVATSLSQFIRSCYLFHLHGHMVVRSGSLDFFPASMQKDGKGTSISYQPSLFTHSH